MSEETDLERAKKMWVVDYVPPGLNESNVLQRRFIEMARLPASEISLEAVIANFLDNRHNENGKSFWFNCMDVISEEFLERSMDLFEKFQENDEVRACVLYCAFAQKCSFSSACCKRPLRKNGLKFTPKSTIELDVLALKVVKPWVEDNQHMYAFETNQVLGMLKRTASTPEGRALFCDAHREAIGELVPILKGSPKKWTKKAIASLEQIIALLYKPDHKRLRDELEDFQADMERVTRKRV